jgi:FkbM family methyltransferase
MCRCSSRSMASIIQKIIKMIFHKVKNLFNIKTKYFSHHSFSQEGEDMILREIFQSKEKGFYVDIGAYHPTRFSNTNYFYQKGWSGINIEPSPDGFLLFEKERTRDINLNFGISDQKSEINFYVFDEPALNTFDSGRVEYLKSNSPYRIIRTIPVKVDRLDNLLNQYSTTTTIDFMNIDVEWHESVVLQSNDWSKFKPKIILLEVLDFSIETFSSNPLYIFLKNLGYHFIAKTPRTCFFELRD